MYTNKGEKKIGCVICKTIVNRTNPFQKYCSGCAREQRLKTKREYEGRRRKIPEVAEHLRRLQKDWREKNREHVRKKALIHYHKNKVSIRKKDKEWRAEQKKIVYSHYGLQCACCAETTYQFLSIDHINNDGSKQRKTHPHQANGKLYRWIINNNFPDGFQILCMNCNFGKHINGGVCPHSK